MSVRPAALALGLALLLSGCASEDDPAALPVPTAAPSTAPTTAAPTPSATPVSEAQAVEAAVRYYYEGFNRASDTSDAQELAKGTTADCACRSFVDTTAQLLAKGRIEGNRVRVQQVRVVRISGSTALAQVSYVADDGRLVAPDGREVEELRGEPQGNAAVDLVQQGGAWLVQNVAGLGG